jgi:hypothetical protein
MVAGTVWESTLQRHLLELVLSRVSAYDWFASVVFPPLGFALWSMIAATMGASGALWLACLSRTSTPKPRVSTDLRFSTGVARSQERRVRQPQIRDVAARAGVGVGTVSRVLNESPRVAEATRQRVLKAIEELGFRQSPAGRRLSLGRTQTLGVLAPFFTQSSVGERLRGTSGSSTKAP